MDADPISSPGAEAQGNDVTTPPSAPPSGATVDTTAAPATPEGFISSKHAETEDPYAEFDQFDYDALLQQSDLQGMDSKELKSMYGPAKTLIDELGADGLEAVLESADFNGRALGSSPEMLRACAGLAEALRRDYLDHAAAYQRVATLAKTLGEKPPAAVRVAPLPKEHLDHAIRQLIGLTIHDHSLAATLTNLAAKDGPMRRTLENIITTQRERRDSLQALWRQEEAYRARLERPGTMRTLPSGRQTSTLSLDEQIAKVREEAQKKGDWTPVLKDKLALLQKARYGGGDAA